MNAERKLIFFGAGQQAHKCYHMLCRLADPSALVCICDNNASLQNSALTFDDGYSVPILSLEEALRQYSGAVFWITPLGRKFRMEIQVQLLQAGVDQESILTWVSCGEHLLHTDYRHYKVEHEDHNENLQVHFSIDDVGWAFRSFHDRNAQSLFEIPMFSQLKLWHETYGARYSLYVFEITDFWWLWRHFPSWKRDFSEAAEWLRFGFHGNKLQFSKDAAYVSAYELFEYVCGQFGAGQTDKIRLHNWIATPEQKKFLYQKGIRTLLYPNDSCLRYDETGCFIDEKLLHKKTDIRLEYLNCVTEESLLIGKKAQIEIFTHEGCFPAERDKIERAIQLYNQNGYRFI